MLVVSSCKTLSKLTPLLKAQLSHAPTSSHQPLLDLPTWRDREYQSMK